jgi:hypothetical protein
MDLYVLYSILAVDIFICFIFWITKGILRLHTRANILGILLVMLLSQVEIHICHL